METIVIVFNKRVLPKARFFLLNFFEKYDRVKNMSNMLLEIEALEKRVHYLVDRL